MANPASKIREAMQASHPGASVVARGRNWLRHQITPNTFALDASIGPLHIAGTETEINSDWQPDTGAWQWKMEQADFHAHARDVFNAGNLCEYRDPATQEWVIFDPQSINWINQDTSRQQIAIKQAVNAQVNGDVMSFPDAYGAGRHFRYELQTARLQKLITIDTLASLPAPTVTGTIWFEAEFTISTSPGVAFYLDGVKWAKVNNVRVQTANRIECRDEATGQTLLWVLDFPRAFDSDGNEVIGEMEVRRSGGATNLFITVRIPKTWIDAAVFPIFIDPSIDPVISAGLRDVFHDSTDSANPPLVTNNTSGIFHGTGNVSLTHPRQAGLIFPLALDPGVTIDGAYLEVVKIATGNGIIPIRFTADVSNFSSAWPASGPLLSVLATKSTNRPAYNTTFNYATANTYYRLADPAQDLSALIQEVVDASGWSNGALLRLVTEGYGSVTNFQSQSFHSYETNTSLTHRMHVDYTEGGSGGNPPDTPSIVSVTVLGGA